MTRNLSFLVAIFGVLAPAFGQLNVPPRQPQRQRGVIKIKLTKVEIDGTLVGAIPGGVQVMTITNQKWFIYFNRETLLFVRGKAEADFLRPGLCIQFNAEINKRGRAQEKITQMVLTTPTPMNPLGCREEEAMGMALAAPEVGGVGGGAPPAAKPAAKAVLTKRYTVHGRISKLKNGKMTIVAGGAKIEAEIDENVDIDVAMNDISVARVGDKITVKGGMPPVPPGMVMQPGMIGKAQASQVDIEMQKPLTGPRKKPIKKPLPKKPVRRPGAKPKPEGKDAAKPGEKPPVEAVDPPAKRPKR